MPQASSLKPPPAPCHIRWMIRRDMSEVYEIEQESFECPWNEDDFIRHLRLRNCIGMVADWEERVAGFMVYELHRRRLHLLNLAVARDFRRRGVGRQLVAKCVGKLAYDRRDRIHLEVRETNVVAQQFFRAMNFRAVGVLRDFYRDIGEDAYTFRYLYPPRDGYVLNGKGWEKGARGSGRGAREE
jgi:ribosomal-protein-alanine N-acetyltransferase